MSPAVLLAAYAAIRQYWPVVVAGLFLLYTLAAAVQSGNYAAVAPALAAFTAAVVAQSAQRSATSAHGRIDELIDPS